MSKSTRTNALLLCLIAAMFALTAGACSSSDSDSGSAVGDEVAGAAEDVGDAVSDAASEVSGAVEDVGSDDSSGTLPGWAWALIAAIGVLALVGVIMGFQNRSNQGDTSAQ